MESAFATIVRIVNKIRHLRGDGMSNKNAKMMFDKLYDYCSEIGYTEIVEIKFEMYEALVRTLNGRVDKLIFNTVDGWH